MDSANLHKLQEELQEVFAFRKSKVKHEDAVIFYGHPSSGKSSIINYMNENEPIGKRIEDRTVSIESVNKSSGPEIRKSAASKIPIRWENLKKLPGLAVWNVDTPDFENDYKIKDTIENYKIKDIKETYEIEHIFKSIESVKIILVIDIDGVTDNWIKSFVNLFESVEIWLNFVHEFYANIGVIFTKVPDTILGNSVNKEFIIKLLHQKLLSWTETDEDNFTKFVEYLMDNQRNVGLFKQAKLGPITGEIEVDIIECIKNVKSIKQSTLKDIKFNFFKNSYIFLHLAKQELFRTYKLNTFLKTVCVIFNDNALEYLGYKKNNASKENLLSIKSKLNDQLDRLEEIIGISYSFRERIDFLRIIIPAIETKFDIDQLVEMLEFMEFADDSTNLKEVDIYNIKLLRILNKFMWKFNKILVNIEFELREIDRNELEELRKGIDLQQKRNIKILENELEDIQCYNRIYRKKLGFDSNIFLKLLLWITIIYMIFLFSITVCKMTMVEKRQ